MLDSYFSDVFGKAVLSRTAILRLLILSRFTVFFDSRRIKGHSKETIQKL
jgi:hypothetical protein